jgi:hypothetical protein
MPPQGDDMKVYDVALPPHQAEAEWQEFARDEAVVRSVGDVRFDAAPAKCSRLAIRAENPGVGIDALVQRFRERLKRRGLV